MCVVPKSNNNEVICNNFYSSKAVNQFAEILQALSIFRMAFVSIGFYSGFRRNARVLKWASLLVLLFFAFGHKTQSGKYCACA